LIAQLLSPPRSRLTISVANASPSTSSATTSKGTPVFTACSSSGTKSLSAPIFRSESRMRQSSNTAAIFSASVMK